MKLPLLLTPAITGLIETALNAVLFRDNNLRAARARLVGKTLRIELQDFNAPLVLVFSEKRLDVLAQSEDQADCTIKTQLSVLMKLRDRQQLSALIRTEQLIVEGDLQVVQQFTQLLDLTEWDAAEWLSPYIGDIAAQGLTQVLGKGAGLLRAGWVKQQDALAQRITEEWQLAPGALEVAWLCDEINAIDTQAEALLERLAQQERQHDAK